MSTHAISAFTGCLASMLVFAIGSQPTRGPVVINLDKPGDALMVTMNGKPVGGLRVDDAGRLGVFGPNKTSTAITIDGRDRVQIDPEPVASPPTRLTIANDVWLTGVLRVGRADAFGDAPFDPNGAIQVGRNLPKAQPMALFRAYAQGKECFRLGATKEGHGFWSDGAHDTPLLTFKPSAERDPESGRLVFYRTELRSNHGELKGRNQETGSTTTLVPE